MVRVGMKRELAGGSSFGLSSDAACMDISRVGRAGNLWTFSFNNNILFATNIDS